MSNSKKQSDVFINFTTRVAAWLQKNSKTVFITLISGLIIAISLIAYNWHFERKTLLAQQELFKIEKDLFQIREKNLKEDQAQNSYTDIIPKLQSFVESNKGNEAGKMAALHLSRIYYQQKDYTNAEKILPAIELAKGSSFLDALLVSLKATSMEAQNKCDVSVTLWQSVLSVNAAVSIYPEILLRQALCYEKIGQSDKASEVYKKIVLDHNGSQAAQKAKTYLRWLGLNKAKES